MRIPPEFEDQIFANNNKTCIFRKRLFCKNKLKSYKSILGIVSCIRLYYVLF